MADDSKSRIKNIKEEIEKLNEKITKLLSKSDLDLAGFIYLAIKDGEYCHNHVCENLDGDDLFDLLSFFCASNTELFIKVLGMHLMDMHEKGESLGPIDKSKMM